MRFFQHTPTDWIILSCYAHFVIPKWCPSSSLEHSLLHLIYDAKHLSTVSSERLNHIHDIRDCMEIREEGLKWQKMGVRVECERILQFSWAPSLCTVCAVDAQSWNDVCCQLINKNWQIFSSSISRSLVHSPSSSPSAVHFAAITKEGKFLKLFHSHTPSFDNLSCVSII